MAITDIKELASLLDNFGLGAVIGGGIIYFFVKSYIPSYLTKKAENLATKEDISKITDQVEAVKIDYAKILEEIRSDNQLKLAGIEREKTLKKEVYLKATEAVVRSQNMINTLPNLNLSNEEIMKNISEDSGIIGKIQIVGTQETVRATTTFMAAIGTKTIDLMLERSTLLERKATIEKVEKLKTKSQLEVDRYIELMKTMNLQGNQDQGTWRVIESQVDFENNQIDKHTNTVDKLCDIQGTEHIEFTRKCISEYFEISVLLPPIILAVRGELELDISPENYLDIFNNNLEQAKKVFDEFFVKVSS